MDELHLEELSVRVTQEKMDDAFRAAMQRTIEAGEEKTPTVVSRKAWPAKSEELIRRLNPPFRVVIIPAVFRQDATRFFIAQHCATLIVQVRLWIAVEDRRQFAKLPLALGSGW
jgi:hypothetical protein